MSEDLDLDHARWLAKVIADVAQSDGTAAVEIAGVRIERCDEYGKTATTIDLEQTRLDLAAVEDTVRAAGVLVGQLQEQLDAVTDREVIAEGLRNGGVDVGLIGGHNYRLHLADHVVAAVLSGRKENHDG